MTADRGAIGWGVGLVAFGAGLLLRNVGAWPPGLSVWPVALVAAGVAMLLVGRGRPEGGALVVPLALIIVGGGFALRALPMIPTIGIFPVLLIALGVLLLVSSSRKPEPTTTSLRLPVDGAQRLHLILNHGAGELRISAAPRGDLLLDASFTGGAQHDVVRRDGEVEISLKAPNRPWERSESWRRWDWLVALNPDVPVRLDLRTGATKTFADLRDLRVSDVSLKTGASQTEIVAPSAGHSRIRVEAGAASVTVRVPEGVAAEIRNRSALGSFEVDEFRFPRSGPEHRSEGYDEAENRVEIDIEGGLASFTVR
jgi:hypothetical protein